MALPVACANGQRASKVNAQTVGNADRFLVVCISRPGSAARRIRALEPSVRRDTAARGLDFGDYLFGTVAFDEAVIVPGFTGTVSSVFAGTFATSRLAARSIVANAAQAPTFTFLNSTLVAWNLRTDFTLLPGIANHLVPLFTANGSDSFSPINGGQVLGRASAAGASWILQSVPAPVPLPQSRLLLAAGMAWLGTLPKAVSRRDELAKQAT